MKEKEEELKEGEVLPVVDEKPKNRLGFEIRSDSEEEDEWSQFNNLTINHFNLYNQTSAKCICVEAKSWTIFAKQKINKNLFSFNSLHFCSNLFDFLDFLFQKLDMETFPQTWVNLLVLSWQLMQNLVDDFWFSLDVFRKLLKFRNFFLLNLPTNLNLDFLLLLLKGSGGGSVGWSWRFWWQWHRG